MTLSTPLPHCIKDTPLVSIIMNCYNSASTLAESFDSVLTQEYTHWEIIFFDSASEDASLCLAQSYAAKHTRIRCFHHAQCIPLGEARNRALQQAQGQYIAFLDCDDLWLPQKLALQVAYMQANPHIDILCTETENFCDSKILGKFFTNTKPERGSVFSSLIQRQWMALSSIMLRASSLLVCHEREGKPRTSEGIKLHFDPRFMLCSDADLLYRLAYDGQCDFLSVMLTRRRIHRNNISHIHTPYWHQEIRKILAKCRKLYPNFDENYPQVMNTLEQRALFHEALFLWRSGSGRQARSCLRTGRSKKIQAQGHRKNTIACKMPLKHVLLYLYSFLPTSAYFLGLRLYLSWARFL